MKPTAVHHYLRSMTSEQRRLAKMEKAVQGAKCQGMLSQLVTNEKGQEIPKGQAKSEPSFGL